MDDERHAPQPPIDPEEAMRIRLILFQALDAFTVLSNPVPKEFFDRMQKYFPHVFYPDRNSGHPRS